MAQMTAHPDDGTPDGAQRSAHLTALSTAQMMAHQKVQRMGQTTGRPPREVARKGSVRLLDHAPPSLAGEEAVEHARQPPEHPMIKRLRAEEVAVTHCGVGARREAAHKVPPAERQYVVEFATVGEAACKRSASVDGKRRHAAVALDTLCPGARKLAEEKPGGGDVLAREQAHYL